MSASLESSGTQLAVINTEHTLHTVSTAGTFSFHVSLLNMTTGDTLELRIYQKILTGDSPYVAYKQSFYGAPDTDGIIAVSVPIANDLLEANSLQFTMKQVAGTGRSFKWKILRY